MCMVYTQILMSVMLIMEDVSMCVPTLMAAFIVLVIMDINSFKMILSIVPVCNNIATCMYSSIELFKLSILKFEQSQIG